MHNIDLSTDYMGLKLKSPLIASSSDYTFKADSIKQLAEYGVGAVVLKSLFEEQIAMEINSLQMNNMFNSFTYNEDYIAYYTKHHEISQYLTLIQQAKQQTDIPIIASINCYQAEEWMSFAKKIEDAGADALELNIFFIPSDPQIKAEAITKRYFDIIEGVRKHTQLPIAVKLHHYFTDMAYILSEIGKKVDSIVMFNRFFNPDINLETLKIQSGNTFSCSDDYFNVLRWIGIMYNKSQSHLSASGGVHDGLTMLKMILAGANVVQVASVFYMKDISFAQTMLEEAVNWMSEKGYKSTNEMRGKLSQQNISNPMLFERAQFMKYFSDFNKTK